MHAAPSSRPIDTSSPAALDALLERVCARVAPTWPLDRFIAVNPLWGYRDMPFREVVAMQAARFGARLVVPRAMLREQLASGALDDTHLRDALAWCGAEGSAEALRARLAHDLPPLPVRARVCDLVEAPATATAASGASWRSFITHSVSQFCAAFFDDAQGAFRIDREGGLYASWRRYALRDRSPALLMGLREFNLCAAELETDARAEIARCLEVLDVPAREHEAWLTAVLHDVNGWASWCAFRRWEARLAQRDDAALIDLLAVRVGWERILWRSGDRTLATRWRHAVDAWGPADARARRALADDVVALRALELAWQQGTAHDLALATRPQPDAPTRPSVQAVFCIDVRSEPMRRALEAALPTAQTIGFAGFFGLPVEYLGVGTSAPRPQLPGLLAPRLRVTDEGATPSLAERRRERLSAASAWSRFQSSAISSFSRIEATGWLHAVGLLGDSFGRGRSSTPHDGAGLTAREQSTLRPRLTATAGGGALDLAARCDLAEAVLRAMSLTHGFAPLVVLFGHGGETTNNPHAAGLDCGACGGQRGELNARTAAALLNEPEVRSGLRTRGIDVPDETWFAAGLHNTTTDDVTLREDDGVPETHRAALHALQRGLVEAGERCRAERAAGLGLKGARPHTLHRTLRGRASDPSEVRPEWGLANNAGLIVAPRSRTREISLGGRVFLHDYRHEDDPDRRTLTLILTAPMVVAHWINLQYFASTTDNARYGSGDKTLHNVVGATLGVFEGNGGDLRIGLPMQSVHDGRRAVHTPLRLSVFVQAPREAIEEVIRAHDVVRSLVENEWLFLFQLEDTTPAVHALRQGRWRPVV